MSRRAWRAPSAWLESLARLTPWLILVYFALQFVIRIALSSYLETDEAQFVGQTYFALGYGNSHPPLYNWLVAAALWLTAGHWAAALAFVKNALLAGAYCLAFDLVRRVTGRALSGMMAAASLLFLPQILWKSQVTLAHSVLVMFAIVAVMHAVALIVRRGDALSFLWLGLSAAIGLMAKYNFVLSLAAVLGAALSLPDIRRALSRPALAFSVAVFSILLAPHIYWALTHWSETTGRLAKLERENRVAGWLDMPYIGVDGVLSALIGSVAWAGPLVIVWFLIWRFSKPSAALAAEAENQETFRRFFGAAALFGFLAFLTILAVGDLHYVHERYLTAVLMPLPFWLTLSWPLDRREGGALRFLGLGSVMVAAMIIVPPLITLFGREHLAYPYRAFAAELESYAGASAGNPLAVASIEEKYAANIALLLKNATVWRQDGKAKRILAIWPGKAQKPSERLSAAIGEEYSAEGAPFLMQAAYENFSGVKAQLGAQLYVRKP